MSKEMDSIVVEIGLLRLVGLIGVMVGVGLMAVAPVYGAELAVYGVPLAIVGLVVRAIGGIWGTLERMARR